ncbi:helix-turn-helix domain-containing protein [Amycolatopsis magusensis]|uniref:helix-turn-helix domain-containing protein n=1 Tax=Amycolatopsis magusensis TaxID=882444 RepID=UPI003C2EBA29
MNEPSLPELAEPTARLGYQPKHAAVLLDVPVKTIRGLIHSGELGHRKIGRYYVIPHSELVWFLDCARNEGGDHDRT